MNLQQTAASVDDRGQILPQILLCGSPTRDWDTKHPTGRG